MNRVRKGNYYRLKTKKWFEAEGYLVENLERNQKLFIKGKVIFIKKDVWGSDLMAKNDKEIIFIQCKTNKTDINKGIKELNATVWPKNIRKMVVIWEKRAKEPEIIEC
jgi:hypothetical protein